MTGTDPLQETEAQVRQRWRPGPPGQWTAADVEDLMPLLPAVQDCVAKADPEGPEQTKRHMRATAGHIVDTERRLGTTDPAVVRHRDNVEYRINDINAHRPHAWRGTNRSHLRVVGRAVTPEVWPTPPAPVTRPYVCPPYDARENESYRLAAELLPTTAYRAARTFVVAGALGAGLNAAEMARAHPRDVQELDEGRLAMRVNGHHPQLAPVRRDDPRRDP